MSASHTLPNAPHVEEVDPATIPWGAGRPSDFMPLVRDAINRLNERPGVAVIIETPPGSRKRTASEVGAALARIGGGSGQYRVTSLPGGRFAIAKREATKP